MYASERGYKFAFDTSACKRCGGKCCYGESGYVFASTDELQNIASFLNMDFTQFCLKHVKRVGSRFSFVEKECFNKSMGLACIFFDEFSGRCSIYDVRPSQCKRFPFWSNYKDSVNILKKRCVGIVDK